MLYVINQEIGPDPSFIWVSLGYSLGIAVSCLIWGRLSDIFGRRWFFIGGSGLALLGSALGAGTPNITGLIFAMLFIGLAFPAQLSFSVALAELIPNAWRGYMNGLLFLVAVPFSTFGPLIGRKLQATTEEGWRWAMYMNLILCGVSMILAYFFYHPPNFERLHTKYSKRQILKNLDYLGMALFTAGLALFLTGLNWGGSQYPWTSGQTLGTLIGGLGVLAIFVAWEIFGAKEPLLPMRFMTNKAFVGLVLCAGAGSAVFYPLNLIWPQQITVLYTSDPDRIGYLSCALGGGALLGQVLSGLLLKALGKQKWQMVFTATAMTAFIGAMSASTQSNETTAIALCIMGSIMLGYVENVALTLAPFTLDDKDIGVAIGILASLRTTIAGIATAIYTTVLNNKLSEFVPQLVTPAAEGAGLKGSSVPALIAGFSSGSFAPVEGLTDEILAVSTDAYQKAFVKSIHIVYLATLAFGALAIGGGFFVPNVEDKFNATVARRMHASDVAEKEEHKTRGDSVA